MKKVLQSVPEGDRAEFQRLLMGVVVSEGFKRKSLQEALSPVNGKDATAVLAHLRAEESARKAEARAKQEAELAELKSRESDFEREVKKLERIGVADVRVSQSGKNMFMRYKLEATISNNLDVALSAVKIAYQLKSPERAVPWNDGEAWFFVKGGIEPGESIKDETYDTDLIVLANATVDHPDAVLSVKLVDAYDADKKSVVKIEPLNDFDRNRMDALSKELQ